MRVIKNLLSKKSARFIREINNYFTTLLRHIDILDRYLHKRFEVAQYGIFALRITRKDRDNVSQTYLVARCVKPVLRRNRIIHYYR